MTWCIAANIRQLCWGILLFLGPQVAVASDGLPENFKRFDRNGDGKLALAEVPLGVRGDVFPRYDVNRDQQLDAGELAAFMADRKTRTPPASASPGSDAKHLQKLENIEYASSVSHGGNFGRLDLYLPKDKKTFPVVMFVHGGAMIKGDKSALRPLAERLVLHGFGVAAINYRLSPAVKFPAHVEDVAAAFAWIHVNIRQHGGDPGRIFVAGGSAGGYLVALLSVDGRYLKKHGLGLDNIKGTVAISGLMNTAKVPKERLKLVWGGDPAVTRLASPIQYVSKDVPAMLILFADGDTAGRKQQNRHMANALKRAGHKDVSVKEMANRTHDSIREHMAEANDPGLKRMLDFMKRLAAP